ncbi:hypothetical protein [Yunchengibacter salinarum]|uniref:hypothetical protein n=1 Tax=Yunchengibacter salinarum TaxID=3133399 RepID=UPI0035B63A0A
MALKYHRDLFRMAVCDMAKSSDKFSARLRSAWLNYLYRIHWDELEAALLEEDLPIFKRLKKHLYEDLMNRIQTEKMLVMEQTANAPRPLSEEQASKYANAGSVIMAMNGHRAKNIICLIVDFYSTINQTIEYKR